MKKKTPKEDDLKKINVENWGVWSKKKSVFPLSYGVDVLKRFEKLKTQIIQKIN